MTMTFKGKKFVFKNFNFLQFVQEGKQQRDYKHEIKFSHDDSKLTKNMKKSAFLKIFNEEFSLTTQNDSMILKCNHIQILNTIRDLLSKEELNDVDFLN